jgi:lipopolysaccharide transport system permease protein
MLKIVLCRRFKLMNDNTEKENSVPGETLIRPYAGIFDVKLRQLWRYRDLIWMFVWRDFVATYKQTILGPIWHIVQPLLTAVTYALIFGRIAGLSTDGKPKIIFYLTGTIVWSYFASCLTKTAGTFVANAHLFGKVYFHRLAIPASIVLSNLVTLCIQMVVLAIIMAIYTLCDAAFHPNWWILAIPVLTLILAGYGLGFGIIVAALTTRYRDLAHLVTFGTQLLMFATPVVYPASSVPDKYRWLIMANPLAPAIEAFRYGALGAGTVTGWQIVYCVLMLVIVMGTGLVLFSKVERTFMDTV